MAATATWRNTRSAAPGRMHGWGASMAAAARSCARSSAARCRGDARMTATRRALLGAAGTLALPAVTRAQPRFPDRPITVLVPFPPGGATDVQMRALAEAAIRAFGQTV